MNWYFFHLIYAVFSFLSTVLYSFQDTSFIHFWNYFLRISLILISPSLSFLLFISLCVCCTCVRECEIQQTASGEPGSRPTCFLRQQLSVFWTLTSRLGCLASSLQRIHPTAFYKQDPWHLCACLFWFFNVGSVTQTCLVASTLSM